MKQIQLLALVLLIFLSVRPAAAAVPRVVVSLEPLQTLADTVMDGVGTSTVLLPGGASPHSYALKPSQMLALERADLVFWIGPGLETFLARPLASLPARVQVVALAELPGLQLLPVRRGGAWETGHAEAAEEHDHHAGSFDQHIWLSTARARLLAGEICRRLSQLDAGHAPRYRANLERLSRQLTTLHNQLEKQLAPFRQRPYLVFHDAYHYFEDEFGLHPVGAVSISPKRPPGARRLRELQAEIKQRQVRCIFREPQFPPRLVGMLTAGTDVRTGVLDPLGSQLPKGAEGYLTLMRQLGDNLQACLE